MRFDDLLALLRGLDLDDDVRRPPRDNVRTIQRALSAGLADEEFCLDCIELELAAIAGQRAVGRRAPMFRMPDRPLRFEMFYWWPGRVAAAHEHTRWTVTAVFFNHLQVTTYDWDVAFRDRRLERKNVFVAPQGQAGHIYDRCIHNPANRTHRDSMSIHIFNVSDVPLIEREVGPIPGLGLPSANLAQHTEPLATRQQRQLRVLAQAVCQYRSPRAVAILDTIVARGDAETQARIERLRWRASRARTAAQDAPGGA
ncbi:MAG TPA: hypothetical protein VHW23_21005 [Kofleriaceae bacterium]|jgi:hypothetical protein|nr:hypothetical protein [Kofleriaceae bacterium]